MSSRFFTACGSGPMPHAKSVPPNSMATLWVFMVRVKVRCSFDMVSYARAVFDDPYSTKVPSSSVFEGSLARNVVLETSLLKVSFY